MTVLSLEVADEVATITLQRPEARNALTPELIEAIAAAVRECDGRDDVAAVVLTGADPAFCAGLDLSRLSSSEQPLGPGAPDWPTWRGALPPHRVPVVGAINGPAITGGLELALACDVLIASDRARFADTHARVGMVPGWGLTVLLPRLVGPLRARQMSFTGNFVSAPQALAWGLVNEVVAHDELLPRARAIARDIADAHRPAVRELKAMYDELGEVPGAVAWSREAEWSAAWARSFDRAAFAARRAALEARGRAQRAQG